MWTTSESWPRAVRQACTARTAAARLEPHGRLQRGDRLAQVAARHRAQRLHRALAQAHALRCARPAARRASGAARLGARAGRAARCSMRMHCAHEQVPDEGMESIVKAAP